MVSFGTNIINSFEFSHQFSLMENDVYLDHNKGIIKIIWEGRIDFETTSGIFLYCADLIEGGLIDKILIDRSSLICFSEESSKWILEEFLRKRCLPIRKHIKKVSIINEKSIAAQIYGRIGPHAIETEFPDLPVGRYDKEEEAHEWILKD